MTAPMAGDLARQPVLRADPEEGIGSVAGKLTDRAVPGLILEDEAGGVWLISEGDLLRALAQGRSEAPVRELAKESPVTVSEEAPLEVVWHSLGASEGRPVAVTSEEGDLAGLITPQDLLGGRESRPSPALHDEHKSMEAELERLATHDPLTGIYNRAKLYQLLEQVLSENRRYATPFSVIMLDIDHFKAINDAHGHTLGDAILLELTQRIGGALRETDALGRWGGEEFLILTPHTGAGAAGELAERLRGLVADTPFPGAGSVTISLGTATIEPGESVEQLEERADRALYAAKEAGRNRVCQAEG